MSRTNLKRSANGMPNCLVSIEGRVNMKDQGRKSKPTTSNLSTVCFRVTGDCNAACPFCQVSNRRTQLPHEELITALEWIADRGARSVKLTGGEPLIYPRIKDLAQCGVNLGLKPTIVTNGLLLTKDLLYWMKRLAVRLKISLHGPQHIHNAVTNSDTFVPILHSVQSAIREQIDTSIHTVLFNSFNLDVEGWIRMMLHTQVNKVTFIPFIRRGRGNGLPSRLMFDSKANERMRSHIHELRDKYSASIIVRYLDLINEPFITFETDGRFYLQYADESKDKEVIITKEL